MNQIKDRETATGNITIWQTEAQIIGTLRTRLTSKMELSANTVNN